MTNTGRDAIVINRIWCSQPRMHIARGHDLHDTIAAQVGDQKPYILPGERFHIFVLFPGGEKPRDELSRFVVTMVTWRRLSAGWRPTLPLINISSRAHLIRVAKAALLKGETT